MGYAHYKRDKLFERGYNFKRLSTFNRLCPCYLISGINVQYTSFGLL